MRLISTINNSLGFKAKVYFDNEWNEYIVKYYDGKLELPEGTFYHTDDKEDAINTAKHEIKFMADNNALTD